MKNLIIKLIPPVLSLLVFGLVIWQVEPPKNIKGAYPWQLILFLTPLLVLSTSLANLILHSLRRSLAVGFFIIFLLLLKGFEEFNLILLIPLLPIPFLLLLIPKNRGFRQRKTINIPKLSHF